jgi:hypothetical protein
MGRQGPFPADPTIQRVDEHLRGFLLVRNDRPEVLQRIGKREVLIEHSCAVMALPPTLSRLDRPEEPRHQASVSTRDEVNQCRRSPGDPKPRRPSSRTKRAEWP